MSMWSKQAQAERPEAAQHPEKLRHSTYYEHEGSLRAYATRAMLRAFLCVPSTLLALAFAVYVRIQPPTVIRVDQNGEATVLGRATKPSPLVSVSVAQGSDAEPTEFEKRAFVRLFLEHYLTFSPASVANNWAESRNMMTANLRRLSLNALKTDNTVGKISDDQMSSLFHVRMVEASQQDPLSFTVYGVKEGHRAREQR